MEINFDFEMNDWMQFQKYHTINSKDFKKTKLFLILLGPTLFCLMIFYDIFIGNFKLSSLILFSVTSLLMGFIIHKTLENITLKKIKASVNDGDNSSVIGNHHIKFENEFFIYTSPESESKMKWTGIKKIIKINDYYFLYNTAVSAIIIPKRKIEQNLIELEHFLNQEIFNRLKP